MPSDHDSSYSDNDNNAVPDEDDSSRCFNEEANLDNKTEDSDNDSSSSSESSPYWSDSYQNSDVENDSTDNEFQNVSYCEEDYIEPPQEERIPLYAGCNITREESKLLIMTYAMRFELSDMALEHLLKLIDCHLPTQ